VRLSAQPNSEMNKNPRKKLSVKRLLIKIPHENGGQKKLPAGK
jgi:hypothetical protein